MPKNINLGIFAVAGGTVDAITATYTPAPASLYNGLVLFFRASGANTSTTPTFKPNTLAAKTIVKEGNQALVAGDIVGDHGVIFNSSLDKWELLNPASDAADTYWQAGAGANSLMDKRSSDSSGSDGFVAGHAAINSGNDGQALGSFAENSENGGQALGALANNSGQEGQAVGSGANNSGFGGQAIGSGAINTGEYGQAVGREANNQFDRSTALGNQSVSTAEDQTNISQTVRLQAYTGAGTKILKVDNDGIVSAATHSEFFGIACSDETTVLSAASTSVPVATMHVPYAMTLTKVYAGLRTAGTGAAVVTVDIHVNGTTIMSATKILFTASQKLSADGVLTTTALAAGDYVEIFLDQRDTDNVATGLKTYLVGHQ